MGGSLVRQREDIAAVPCPCGLAQRVLTASDPTEVSVHFVTITQDSVLHHHRQHTEIYVGLTGAGHLELDDQRYELRAGTVALIPPGTRHRAVPGPEGLTVLNVVRPPFDPEDEYVD